MADHKSVAIVRQCITGPSAIHTRKQRNTAHNTLSIEKAESDFFTGDTLESLLSYTHGDTLKTSRLLESRLTDSRAKIAALTSDGGGVDFETRLAALKAEHKRTVDLCEGLYYLSLEQQKQKKQQPPKQPQPQKTVTFRAASPGASQRASAEFIRASLTELESRVLLEERPPLPKSSNDARGGSRDRVWPPTETSSESGGIGTEDDREAQRHGYQELLKSKVNAMWSDFRVSEARSGGMRRSGSLDGGMSFGGPAASARQPGKSSAVTVQQPKKSKTVPEPFTMTLRDSSGGGSTLRKSRSMLQFEAEQRRRQEEEEAALRVRFHANPVPAHVRMPLYDELTEQQEARRIELHQRSRDILRSTERPFNFAETSAERPSTAKETSKPGAPVPTATFRANPVPPSSSSGEAVLARQRLHQEDELLRQIKIKMRSEETLKQSAAPGDVAARQRRMEEERKARLAKYSNGGSGGGKQPRPRSADAAASRRRRDRRGADPPDFKRLHWAFGQDVLVAQQRTPPAPPTQPKPFRLRTEQRGSQRAASASAVGDERRRRSSIGAAAPSVVGGSIVGDFAGRSQRTLVRHEEAPPARLTQSAMLRDARLSAERQAAERRRAEANSESAKRAALRRELAGTIRQSLELAAANSGPSIQEKTRSRIESQREQDEAYKQRLREIHEKMKQRDLLVVQQAKLIAQQKAQAKYRKTLEDAGVDPKEVDENAKKYQDGDLKSYTQDFDEEPEDDFVSNGNGDLDATRRDEAPSPASYDD